MILSIKEAKNIFKENFIGPEEMIGFSNFINLNIPSKLPVIDFNITNLNVKDYILILGIEKLKDGTKINLQSLISIFGYSKNSIHPNFYNQDWYHQEKFINRGISNKWYLIKKNVIDSSRGNAPSAEIEYRLPSAILTAFVFYMFWFKTNKILWENDFIWCSDRDSEGDRIYVGKYKEKINPLRSGFSIHRHLSLRKIYGSIEVFK